ncbi:hypothetical protein J3459_015833 [Metarhizium acridum]|nr:hypothetical protein J3459_015833 [Metarhizium acridum]
MKGKNDVIREFNELVNMSAAELEKWLKSGDSQAAGWSKEDDGGGESVGHDSGRKIVHILKDNPQKSPDKYTDDQIQHMRKVVSYCKRHLAQESKINDNKSVEEVKKTKSYASLKNWGHDPLKERQGNGDEDDNEDAGEDEEEEGDEEEDEEEEEEQVEEEEEEEVEEEEEEEVEDEDEEEDEVEDVGTKRASKDNQDGENKRPRTQKSAPKSQKNGHNGATKSANKQDTTDDAETEQDTQESASDEDGQQSKKTERSNKNGSSGKKGPNKGDTVSWNWGQGQPEGTVKDVKHEKASVTTKKGNTVSRDGTSENPAVVIDAGSSKAVKLNSELN